MSINYRSGSFRFLRYAHYFLHGTVSLLIIITAVEHFLVSLYLVDGKSMEPTLHPGELVAVDLLWYRSHTPNVGELVMATHPSNPDRPFVKRIAGVPGEAVSVAGGVITAGDNQYVLLGDNPPASTDSRQFGPLAKEQIVGRVVTFQELVSSLKKLFGL